MHPVELWWWIEANQPEKMYGKMTEVEAKHAYERAYGKYNGV
jgi:hypothetical protein